MVHIEQNQLPNVIKRDGSIVPYEAEKLYQVILWASNDNSTLADSVMEALQIRIYDRIRIEALFDEVIDTVYNMISRISPQYEPVAKRLFLQKMYKGNWSMNRNMYPHLSNYFDKVKANLIPINDHFTSDELDILSSTIVPDRDQLSSYLGLQVFFEKYSLKVDNQPVELLQHGFMRLAMQGYLHDKSTTRIQKIINRYNNLSLGRYTEATPKWKNSLRPNYQAASCCVHYMDDTTESINKVTSDVGQYSRYDGGNAADISALRSSGSSIGTKGKSSGPIPFIRKVQSSIEAFNQSGSRPGICILTYSWWHADIMDLLPLLDEGGKENQRARNLKYTVKLNRIFLRAIESNSDVHLFDPKDVPELLHTHGAEFDAAYNSAIARGLSKQVISAQSIAYELARIRSETGNVYLFFSENVNESTPFNAIIHSSNACTEIFLPTNSSVSIATSAALAIDSSKYVTTSTEQSGLTALCNLSSVNVVSWMGLSIEEKHAVAKELLEASDNQIDDQFYPTVDGEIFNRNYRAIGIGQNNLAYYFAKHGIKFSSPEALTHMEAISKSIYEVFTHESEQLAIARGNFPWYHKTNLVRPSRFATLFSIAPTSTSSLIIDATEGIEPVTSVLAEKTGTFSTKQLAPGLAEFGMNYELSADIPTKSLYDLAAIRQKYLDQGQSLNTYTKDNTSSYEVISDIIYAESIGLKSLYYLQSSTSSIEVCESCGS